MPPPEIVARIIAAARGAWDGAHLRAGPTTKYSDTIVPVAAVMGDADATLSPLVNTDGEVPVNITAQDLAGVKLDTITWHGLIEDRSIDGDDPGDIDATDWFELDQGGKLLILLSVVETVAPAAYSLRLAVQEQSPAGTPPYLQVVRFVDVAAAGMQVFRASNVAAAGTAAASEMNLGAAAGAAVSVDGPRLGQIRVSSRMTGWAGAGQIDVNVWAVSWL